MKINDIVTESTTAGSIATVAAPMTTQSRNASIYGGKKGGNLLTGKKTNKKYANSVNESKMKELAMDIRNMDNGNFKKKYGKTKEHFKATLGDPDKKTVSEAQLEEDDVIVVPGQGRSRKTGFIKHGESRLDHEVEMARSDLFQAAKNAKQVYEMIADVSEEEGLEGWVQEKIIKANDYLSTIREYLEHKQLQEMTGGVIAGGGVGESMGNTYRFVLPDGIATKYGIDGNAYNKLASMAMAVKQELLRGSHFDQAVSKLNIPVELKDAMREGAMNSIRSKFFIDFVKEYQDEQGVNEGIVDKIKGVVRREKAKDMPLVQTRRDYAMGKGGDAYNKGEIRKGNQYMAYAEKDRKKKGDPTTNPAGTYRTKTTDYSTGDK